MLRKKTLYRILVLVTLLIILNPVMMNLILASPGLTCSVKASCDLDEETIFGLWDIDNSHAGDWNYGNQKVCCKDPDPGVTLTPNIRDTACLVNEGGVVKLFDTSAPYSNSHVDDYDTGTFTTNVCLHSTAGQVQCGQGPCSGEETCVVKLYKSTNSHACSCTSADPNCNIEICCGYETTVTCSDYSFNVECEADANCDWCLSCSGSQWSGGPDRCIDTGTCNYWCDDTQCGAECDAPEDCATNNCLTDCTCGPPIVCSDYDSGEIECESHAECDWCPECSGNQYSGGLDRCVDTGTCAYWCEYSPVQYCGSECEIDSDCTSNNCLTDCTCGPACTSDNDCTECYEKCDIDGDYGPPNTCYDFRTIPAPGLTGCKYYDWCEDGHEPGDPTTPCGCAGSDEDICNNDYCWNVPKGLCYDSGSKCHIKYTCPPP